MREEIRAHLMATGAVAVGFARATPLGSEEQRAYEGWLARGWHAGMEYMERHAELRRDPANVLEGVRTVISLAYSFEPAEWRDVSLPVIACYAYGDDYHDVLKRRLGECVEMELKPRYGGGWRVCVDTAPLPERLWAMRAGIGRMGRNGAIIIDGYGSRVFLAEVLTTVGLEHDEASERVCEGCGACVRVCPGHALGERGEVDARRCLSYLTIEHRGDFPPEGAEVMRTPAGRRTLYGCDLCLSVCPHNRGARPTEVAEFRLREPVASLRAEDVEQMGSGAFRRAFKGSPLLRARPDGLRRNAKNVMMK